MDAYWWKYKPIINTDFFTAQYPATFGEVFAPMMKKGDRVRIKEGYDSAGSVGYYVAKSNDEVGMVIVEFPSIVGEPVDNTLLADAIEPYPYTREERIERAIEDYDVALRAAVGDNGPLLDDDVNLLYAILDAGI